MFDGVDPCSNGALCALRTMRVRGGFLVQRVRFVDEGADFRNYTYAKYGRVVLEQPEQFAWQVFDKKITPILRGAGETAAIRFGLAGVKGVGELGTIGATPTVVNAVADALVRHGKGPLAAQLQMPLTPARVWTLLQH